jgi:hypothetical protein
MRPELDQPIQVSDIGGHPLKDGGWFRAGLVFRISGGPVRATELAHLETLSLRFVVDLRGANEDRRTLVDWARSRDLRYRHVPIFLATPSDLAALFEGHQTATEADGRAYPTKVYRRMLDELNASLVRVVSAIAAAQPAGFGGAARRAPHRTSAGAPRRRPHHHPGRLTSARPSRNVAAERCSCSTIVSSRRAHQGRTLTPLPPREVRRAGARSSS